MPKTGNTVFDVLIVGGGISGLTLASALKESTLTVGLIESTEILADNSEVDPRVSAINQSSASLFQQIGVWDLLEPDRVGAFTQMHVWDAKGSGKIHFDSAEIGIEALGYIIENKITRNALLTSIKNSKNITLFCPENVLAINSETETTTVTLGNGEIVQTQLLVGADGVNSIVRKSANINFKEKDYKQRGIVCTVTTQEPHLQTAWQCFLPTGPLAFLPLANGSSSIVWSVDNEYCEKLMALQDADFSVALEEAFDFQLGRIETVSERLTFPLKHGHVTHYVKAGLALVGDAAHVIHPLAGQGANLGIADVNKLCEVIMNAVNSNKNFSSYPVLRKYERARKGENLLMETSMTGFKNLFGNNNQMLSMLRNSGLNIADKLPVVKNRFMRHAIGIE